MSEQLTLGYYAVILILVALGAIAVVNYFRKERKTEKRLDPPS